MSDTIVFWLVVLYLLIGFGFATGFCNKHKNKIDIEINGYFIFVCLFFPYIIGIAIGEKLQ
jgi:hypothetical protein